MAAELFGPGDVLRMVTLTDYSGLDLTAEEGFLLSRIDGRTPVSSLLSMVSWDRAKTLSLLESLLRKHVINVDRKEVLEAVFGKGDPEQVKERTQATVQANGSRPKVSIDRSKVDLVPDLTEARCIEILSWEQSVKQSPSYYAMLDLPDGADIRAVKREYRRLALAFHPDKFFRKEIGSYRERLESAWKIVQEGYELLLEDEKKQAYDADILSRKGASASVAAGSGPLPAGDTGSVRNPPPAPEEEPPKPMMESALTRKLKAEITAKIEKGKSHFMQAQVDLKEKRYQSADSNAKLAMQFDPRNDEVKAWYEKVKPELEEGIVGALLRRAEMAEASGDRKSTFEGFAHALDLFPENEDANLAMGIFLVRKAEKGEDYKRAKDCLQKVVAKHPKDLNALVHLARAMKALGMGKNALRVLEQAQALAPKDPKIAEEIKQVKRSL